ncbi:RNA-guided endonuclease InsQ/TnpB family protein [Halorientalis regularis]|jgi:putative transposase|uniref:Transposase, IS605 OrfB family, central region n=1 Tax=Halorientalis regularis TaxID=660518 RepID=A0A1G7FDF7_9EURY|nr:RNA-guided endonuclease TnpB family protein [Halorientalis regularis]SDE73864.1 transposase, IS605 OrfB family, central region [Halorientalis regularis]
MEVRRTVPVTLDVESDDAALLEDTVDTFLWCAQYVVDHAFQGEYVTTSKTQLDDETYDDVREATNGFNGGLVQAARNKAAEACKSVVARWKNGKKASKPRITSPHIVYDHRTATFHDDYVSLATTDGRIEADYVLPDGDSDTPHAEYLFSDEYETTGAELHRKHGEWQLHIHCKKEIETDTPERATTTHGTVLGVDLGVNNLAVTSTGTFWTGDEFDHWRREYEKRRGDLQECGTRWAHENMQAVGRKEEGRFKMTLHRIANELVTEACNHECSVIAFEDLSDIRERTGASWGHKWVFNRLYEYVEYKAAEYGITVEQVGPENTSRRCSHCGFTHPANRESESFECQKCGYQNHADYNAAKNIGLRYLRRNQTGGDEGALLGVRLNSGIVNVNGEYESPAEISARTGVHAESHPFTGG